MALVSDSLLVMLHFGHSEIPVVDSNSANFWRTRHASAEVDNFETKCQFALIM